MKLRDVTAPGAEMKWYLDAIRWQWDENRRYRAPGAICLPLVCCCFVDHGIVTAKEKEKALKQYRSIDTQTSLTSRLPMATYTIRDLFCEPTDMIDVLSLVPRPGFTFENSQGTLLGVCLLELSVYSHHCVHQYSCALALRLDSWCHIGTSA